MTMRALHEGRSPAAGRQWISAVSSSAPPPQPERTGARPGRGSFRARCTRSSPDSPASSPAASSQAARRRPRAAVTALVEGRMADAAREAAAEHRRRAASSSSPATSRERHLGLGDADYERLTAQRSTTVHHLAAIYDLAVPLEIAQRVNVDGTGNVLDFCRALQGLPPAPLRLDRVRRGRAHGRRLRARALARPAAQEPLRVDEVPGRGLGARGDAPRPDHDLPPGDRRRRLADRRDAEVRRPVLPAAHDLAVGAQEPADPAVRPRRARRSTSSRSTSSSTRSPRSHATTSAIGETLHLVDPDPLTASELTVPARREYAGKRAVRSASRRRSWPSRCGSSPCASMFEGAPRESIRYLNHPVRFDTRRADEHPRPPRPALPALRRVRAGRSCEFFREHEDDPDLRPSPGSDVPHSSRTKCVHVRRPTSCMDERWSAGNARTWRICTHVPRSRSSAAPAAASPGTAPRWPRACACSAPARSAAASSSSATTPARATRSSSRPSAFAPRAATAPHLVLGIPRR